MCSHAVHRVAIVAVAVAVATAAHAQEAAMYERRVDSLAQVYERAQRRLQAFTDSLTRNTRRYDTVIVPPIRVLTDSSSRVLATEAAEFASATLRRTFGSALDEVARHNFLVRLETSSGRRVVNVGGVGADGQEYNIALTQPRSDHVGGALVGTVRRLLDQRADPAFRHWLGGGVPVDSAGPVVWTNVRLALLSSPMTAGRRCYEGDLAACRAVLGLTTVEDPATMLLDSAGRHRLVTLWEKQSFRALPPEAVSCGGGDDASCISVIRKLPLEMLHALPGSAHRTSIVQTAISLGGQDATERLLITPGGPSQRIAAAAGVPIDSVIRVWQNQVSHARVGTDDMSVGIAASSLLWVVVFGALALRSSRWR